ncbi:MAG: ATP-grasp domain-containing protein [Candidatus Cloacimonetes bacterium]|jgi:carbamoyl-phosphate synthase large subunit|nr:ATP-grasp domain-containing protein [Candidatus Cloacimonadota bacterium]MDD2423345.1 ATP-grasp domain-containing protein [Candidatus Cloacimonadota bacterium]MDD3562691.1 ATP-grasp domain-containing protein [Candidatus Cloacimonadota bacterium]MDD4276611.1 ATP-grasp domain-containing protein [Candidatus Cloacimonadota bacterium]MDY0324645.1 ATP-grasp domain-containing protein [Candidatus Cloacimonadaceae bacterium]
MGKEAQNPDLSSLKATIAVTGLKTGDNPQPGVAVIRSIRAAGFTGRIIGLVYDSMESGIYLEDLVDEVYQMPYPSAGAEAFLARMEYIVGKRKIDVIIPTLDSEVILYIRLQDELQKMGIKSYLPTEECFLLRDKTRLATYFPPRGILVPDTMLISDASQLFNSRENFPMMIKGSYYEAYKANNYEEALKYFYEIESRWGLPILLQKMIYGDEYNIVIVGDGEGGILGMVPQKKLVITDKGKGFGGVVIKNPELSEFASKVISLLKWRGPCELEVMRGHDGLYYLIEINPRFPAWVRLAEGSGQNQPAAVVLKALGHELAELPACKPGTLFIRHAEDIITDISVMGEVSAKSELIRR